MRVVDVDSHFYEPLDWLGESFPKLKSQLPPLSHTEFIFQFVARDLLDGLPPELRPKHDMDLTPGIREFFDKIPSEEQLTEMYRHEPAYSLPDARVKLCDEQGIDVQLINTNWGLMPYMKAQEIGRQDLAVEIAEAYNTWATDRLHGYTDRLIPIAILDLADVPRAVVELTRIREAGCRAFGIKPQPVSANRSLTHPDVEPLWSAAEDLGMIAIFHTGPSGPAQIDPAWIANAGNPATFALLNRMAGPAVKVALAAMVFDGVFERHPKLVAIVEELGIGWLPHFLRSMDAAVGGRGATGYEQPLKPSEYIQRQVRVAALASTDQLETVLGQVPPELVIFSSDYPHPEGTRNPFRVFDEQLNGQGDELREQFYGGSISQLIEL